MGKKRKKSREKKIWKDFGEKKAAGENINRNHDMLWNWESREKRQKEETKEFN